jgi:hypothetical protein
MGVKKHIAAILVVILLSNPLLAVGCPMGGCWTAPPEQPAIGSGNCCQPALPDMTADVSCCCGDQALSSVVAGDAKATGGKTNLLDPGKGSPEDCRIPWQPDRSGSTYQISSSEYQGNGKTPLYLVNSSFLI